MADLSCDLREWLEADGLGGFASGTVSGIRTRRYHAWLLAATRPPTGRMVLMQGADVFVDTDDGRVALSSQCYAPGVVHPDGASRLVAFHAEPWPTWVWQLPDGRRVHQALVVPHGHAATVVRWQLEGEPTAAPCRLVVRPFLSGRDYHSTHHANDALRRDAVVDGERVRWHTYEGGPAIVSLANATYAHDPDWYRQFLYREERARGLDDTEDVWAPGWLTWDLAAGDAYWCVATGTAVEAMASGAAADVARTWMDDELARRDRFATPLHRAADAYLVRRGSGRTVVAGYPWFTDWGRDTFIALRGLCLATGRLAEARDILVEWCDAVSEGMLPNRFPDGGEQPEYNAVDASLWFIVAAGELLAAARQAGDRDVASARPRLRAAAEAILDGYARGTRFGIRADDDGLLACGVAGVQLTWMDARVGDEVVTPRIGKPIEIQALWINALTMAADEAWLGSGDPGRWSSLRDRAVASAVTRFPRPDGAGAYDVIDVDHQPGVNDETIRPNQIFAVGGLPFPVLHGAAARAVVGVVERELWTPIGLRSLTPTHPSYVPRYQGDGPSRDRSYHQGTVWPWLTTAFVEAWLDVHDDDPNAREHARARFLTPWQAHVEDAGIGHVSEIADADPPHTPAGCPFQAWSLGELLRLQQRLG